MVEWMRTSSRLVTFAAVGALVLGACGGSDDGGDAFDAAESASGDTDSDEAGSSDGDADEASDDSSGAGFGEFVSGTIAFSGAEEQTYAVDDPAYTFVGAGGCGGGEFGMSVNVTEADTGYTAFQLGAGIDADLSGGQTGVFEVEAMSLVAVTDGDIGASRSYEGPGTMSITEHDNGGADSDLDSRRMAVTLEGTLDATGADGDGPVDVSADVLWVMGCP
jgi:hypothetical protein